MQLIVQSDGSICCLYGEEFDLHRLGKLSITRASHVADGRFVRVQ